MERVFKGESMSPMVNRYLLFMKPLNLEKHYKKTFKIFVVFIVWMFIVNVVMMKLDDKSITVIGSFIKNTFQSVEIGGGAVILLKLVRIHWVYIYFFGSIQDF